MYHPTTRLLTILELLQTYPSIGGAELATRLEVDGRTVRRYVMMLQDMGIPIDTQRGRHGGYRLRSGFKLPPLMFTNDEALALLLARRLGLGVSGEIVEGTAAKLERVLPQSLRAQLQALQAVLLLDVPLTRTEPVGKVIMALGIAIQAQRQVWICHRSRKGESSGRLVDPYGLVYRAGFWYLVGYCHLRQDLRTFRVDRVETTEERKTTFVRPVEFDPLRYVNEALATTPGIWAIDVLLHTEIEQARAMVPAALGMLIQEPEGVALRCYVQSLDWFASFIVGLPCDWQVRQPAELRDALQQLAAKIGRLVEASDNAGVQRKAA